MLGIVAFLLLVIALLVGAITWINIADGRKLAELIREQAERRARAERLRPPSR